MKQTLHKSDLFQTNIEYEVILNKRTIIFKYLIKKIGNELCFFQLTTTIDDEIIKNARQLQDSKYLNLFDILRRIIDEVRI